VHPQPHLFQEQSDRVVALLESRRPSAPAEPPACREQDQRDSEYRVDNGGRGLDRLVIGFENQPDRPNSDRDKQPGE
jgi:hypothetical protein